MNAPLITQPRRMLDWPPGLHKSVSPAVYYARELEVASNSGLKLFARSPRKYRWWVEHGEDETTDAFALGTAVHCAMLEPTRFERDYIAEPDFGHTRKTEKDGVVLCTTEQGRENKKRRDEWRAEHPEPRCGYLTALQAATIRGMVESVLSHPRARLILEGAACEVTARWRDAATGVACKARFDALHERLGFIADLKSCEDASEDGFAGAIGKYGYHHQADFYSRGGATLDLASTFVFVACEKEPPYECAVHELDDDALALAHKTNSARLEAFARCIETDEWPGLPADIKILSLKPWVIK